MPLNLPSWKDPKARQVYLLAGAVAVGFVSYRWWVARTSTVEVVSGEMDTSSVTDAAGGGTFGGNVQYGGANINSNDIAPTTDAEWTQYAVELMTTQGYDGATVLAALGKYLGNQSMTESEITIVRAALAVAGSPPGGSHAITQIADDTPSASTYKWYYVAVFAGPDAWELRSREGIVRRVEAGGPYESKQEAGAVFDAVVTQQKKLGFKPLIWNLTRFKSLEDAKSYGHNKLMLMS